MSTFVDKFLSMGLNIPSFIGATSSTIAQIRKSFAEAECIVAHNVSEYYFTNDTEYWEFPKDFPMVVPPFRTCVVECARPSRVWSKEKGESPQIRDKLPKTWGVLFQSTKLSEVLGKKLEEAQADLGWRNHDFRTLLTEMMKNVKTKDGEDWVQISVMLHDKTPFAKEVEKDKNFDVGALWFCSATLFTEIPNGFFQSHTAMKDGLMGPLGTYSYFVDKYGYVVGEPIFSIPVRNDWDTERRALTVAGQDHFIQDAAEKLQLATASTHFFPAFLAVSFMHCKNVVMKTQRPPEKLNKKRIRKGNKPLITYRTLEIEPMKKVLRTEGRAEETGIRQALHITRGHFKDYRNSEKGLFGRYKGLWWWDPHLAGKSEHGTIVKDYVELAPGQDETPLEEK